MSHGSRAGSRMKLTKRIKDKGMPKVNEYLKQFEIGDLAAVSIEPSTHAGMPCQGNREDATYSQSVLEAL